MVTLTPIKRGTIYWVTMDPTVGAEIKKTRPALVVSNDTNNQHSSLITILPITSTVAKIYPFEVSVEAGVGGLRKAGVIKANQIRTIDKQRISGLALGSAVNAAIMQQVEIALRIHLGLTG